MGIVSSTAKGHEEWQLPGISRFEWLFFLPFIAGLGGSIGVAYGWTKAFDSDDVIGRHDLSFIGFIAGALIVLLTLQEMWFNRYRLGEFFKILASMSALIDTIFFCLGDKDITRSLKLTLAKAGAEPHDLETSEATKEVLVGTLVSAMFVVWQTVKQKEPYSTLSAQAQSIVQTQFAKPGRMSTDQFTVVFAEELRNPHGDRNFGMLMLDIVLERVKKMTTNCTTSQNTPAPKGMQMFSTYKPVSQQALHIREQIKTFEYNQTLRSWWWVSWAVKIMGLLYAFVIPPAYYNIMGKDIIYVGPFAFFFVGGLVLINICLGDPFTHPTNVQMGTAYMALRDMPTKVHGKFLSRFPPSATTYRDDPPPMPPNLPPPPVLGNKQQYQQQYSQYEQLLTNYTLTLKQYNDNKRRSVSENIDNSYFENIIDELMPANVSVAMMNKQE